MNTTSVLGRLPIAVQARVSGWMELAERGWFLFPVRAGDKRPYIKEWQHRASTDPGRLARFYTAHPECNAGIACGPSGLYVIDADTLKAGADGPAGGGLEVLAGLAAGHGGMPQTWTADTPSGGRHYYFQRPDGPGFGNTTRVLGPLLDTRGAGGYVLAPGSRLAPVPARPRRAGSPGGSYQLIDDTDPAPLPTWIADALTERRSTSDSATPVVPSPRGVWPQRYVDHVIGQELQRVLSARPGEHNHSVFSAAVSLGQLAAAGAFARTDAEAMLTRAAGGIAAEPCDCTMRGLTATIRSGLDLGARRPRAVPGAPKLHQDGVE